ncbi:ScpA-like C-terminal protein [Dioscorea alata]|uniref:ScpA-like C-terminal protein n=1 Tax=Dioscorea alata TaxID=55571 RepID=A0ACB7UMN3_DIOAL|nr:ScpA-like C-terminal protein [Dioscorea alata]
MFFHVINLKCPNYLVVGQSQHQPGSIIIITYSVFGKYNVCYLSLCISGANILVCLCHTFVFSLSFFYNELVLLTGRLILIVTIKHHHTVISHALKTSVLYLILCQLTHA